MSIHDTYELSPEYHNITKLRSYTYLSSINDRKQEIGHIKTIYMYTFRIILFKIHHHVLSILMHIMYHIFGKHASSIICQYHVQILSINIHLSRSSFVCQCYRVLSISIWYDIIY